MKHWDVLSPIFIQHGAIYGSPSSSCVQLNYAKNTASLSLPQLVFYIAAVDGELKAEQDAATIGVLLCKSKNKVVADAENQGNGACEVMIFSPQ
jgi:hypothetical protein